MRAAIAILVLLGLCVTAVAEPRVSITTKRQVVVSIVADEGGSFYRDTMYFEAAEFDQKSNAQVLADARARYAAWKVNLAKAQAEANRPRSKGELRRAANDLQQQIEQMIRDKSEIDNAVPGAPD